MEKVEDPDTEESLPVSPETSLATLAQNAQGRASHDHTSDSSFGEMSTGSGRGSLF